MRMGRLSPWRGPREVGRFNPFREAERMMREMDRWMEHGFGEGFPFFGRTAPAGWGKVPHLDMYEEKDRYIVKAEVPGVDKDDIHVSIVDDLLQIRGESKKEESAREQDYLYSERTYGSFSRSIPLPSTVKADEIKATFKNGILHLEIPKAKEAESKEIKIDLK